MRIAHFDCSSGAAGDMVLGALLDIGLDLQYLKQQLAGLHLSHYDLKVDKVVKCGVPASQVTVLVEQSHHDHHDRRFRDIKRIIDESELPPAVKDGSIRIFRRLAEAEAEVHDTCINGVHFHEVGAVDAVIDVVGAVVGLHALDIQRITCSPIHVGSGTVRCAHGVLPVPAPATARLIEDAPFYSTDVAGELLTPTGAAILTTLCSEYRPTFAVEAERIGYGAGRADLPIPNVLRLAVSQDTYS